MNHHSVIYMWHFKPLERNSIPMDCIHKNKCYIPEYRIVTPRDIIPVLSSFDGLTELWNKIPEKYWVVRADLGRLLYIYQNGGFYLDVDCVIQENPFQSINPNKDRMILFTEFTVSVDALGPRECKNPRNGLRISNYAFASNYKRHPFLEKCIRECMRRLTVLFDENVEKWAETDILWVCGPDVITTMYHAQFKDDGSQADVDTSIRLMERSCLNHLAYGSWRDNK
jgi:mannosyltransferase OCH1-like enzyme